MMAALTHRKFLFAEPEKTPEFDRGFSSNCYMCYVCPDNCYYSSPPPQLSPLVDPRRNHVSTVLILMLCILGVSFIVLSYLTFARYRFRNSRRNPDSLENSGESGFLDENRGPVSDHHIWYIRSVGLPQSLIDSIALFPYKNDDGLIDGHDCSVCLNDFQENERLRLLPKCSHAFHVGCIDTWLRSHKNCPVCRAPILLGNAGNAGSSSGSPETRGGDGSETSSGTESRGVIPILDQTAIISSEKRGIIDAGNGRLRVLSDLGDRRVGDDDRELTNVRRSVSMDLSMMRQALSDKGCSDTKVEKKNSDKRDCKNFCSHLQKGPVSMKRSFSFSGKRSLRKNSRSQESIQVPEISLRNCGR